MAGTRISFPCFWDSPGALAERLSFFSSSSLRPKIGRDSGTPTKPFLRILKNGLDLADLVVRMICPMRANSASRDGARDGQAAGANLASRDAGSGVLGAKTLVRGTHPGKTSGD